MNLEVHKSDSRGKVEHGWLNAKHSFSFGSYHNPERMHFGRLRVWNDDHIKGGGGFGQAGAIRHGITRALLQYDDSLRPTLRSAGPGVSVPRRTRASRQCCCRPITIACNVSPMVPPSRPSTRLRRRRCTPIPLERKRRRRVLREGDSPAGWSLSSILPFYDEIT